MNSQIADDFHAALLAMQGTEADLGAETKGEEQSALLAREVFAFLDALAPERSISAELDSAVDPLERIAA